MVKAAKLRWQRDHPGGLQLTPDACCSSQAVLSSKMGGLHPPMLDTCRTRHHAPLHAAVRC